MTLLTYHTQENFFYISINLKSNFTEYRGKFVGLKKMEILI